MQAARESIDRATGQYVRAINVSRVIIAAASVLVAFATVDEIPGYRGLAVGAPIFGFAWMSTITVCWSRIRPLLQRLPHLVWLDPIVLIGLMLVNKPWDSLVVLPYCSFVFLVPWVRPAHLALTVGLTTVLGYAPKLVLTAADWRFASLVPPGTTVEWFTLYVGPLFCGTVAWALCLLFHGVAAEVAAWEGANAALTQTRAASVRVRARQQLANRLHETLSQVVRAIPLRLDGDPPDGLDELARLTRDRIVGLSLEVRPAVQALARELQGQGDSISSPVRGDGRGE